MLDIGVDNDIVKKSGAWYTYEGEQLGQGRENAKQFLLDNAEIMIEISERIRTKMGIGEGGRGAQEGDTTVELDPDDLPISLGRLTTSIGVQTVPNLSESAVPAGRDRSMPCRTISADGAAQGLDEVEPQLRGRRHGRRPAPERRGRGAGGGGRSARTRPSRPSPSPGATSPPAASTWCACRASPTSRSTASDARPSGSSSRTVSAAASIPGSSCPTSTSRTTLSRPSTRSMSLPVVPPGNGHRLN